MSTASLSPTAPPSPSPEPDLGYFLIPPPDENDAPPQLVPSQLHVILRAQPTEVHFDPTLLHLPMADKDRGLRTLTLGLNPATERAFPVCMGRIVLEDRMHKHVYFFTFGGTVTITVSHQAGESDPIPSKTEYRLASPAPILALTANQRRMDNQLADEMESTLAHIRATWGSDDAAFAERLSQLDPMPAYVGGLIETHGRYARVPALAQEFPQFAALLRQEQARIAAAGLWTAQTPTLTDLLAPEKIG